MQSKSVQVILAIEQDIRARGLKPGQPYQSAREVAKMLGVSPMTANRAMCKMATTGLLERRHGSGTFVGEGINDTYTARSFQIWVPSTFYDLYHVVVERIVKFIHQEFPGDTIQQIFVPSEKQRTFCERVTQAWDDRAQPRTVIAISCSQSVHSLLRELDIPVIAIGAVNRSTCEVPWIDMDYRQSGYLLARCAVEQGHRRLLVLMNRLWGGGDNDFLDGIDVGIKSFPDVRVDARVRSVEAEQQAIEAYLRRLLRAGEPPTALICSSKATAEVAVETAQKLGHRVPEDFFVGTVRIRTPEFPGCPYVYVRWAIARESGPIFCRMVRQVNQGNLVEPNNYVIPVELDLPDALKAARA